MRLKADAVGWIYPGSALVTTFEMNPKISQAGAERGICGCATVCALG